MNDNNIAQLAEPVVAVLIPCHNEEKTIGKVIADAKRVLPTGSKECKENIQGRSPCLPGDCVPFPCAEGGRVRCRRPTTAPRTRFPACTLKEQRGNDIAFLPRWNVKVVSTKIRCRSRSRCQVIWLP